MDKEVIESNFLSACFDLGTELLYKEKRTAAESQFLKALDIVIDYKGSVRAEVKCS
ncbi:hypothetical protein [Peribacillus loiseleuriae]|uniref:hypothetical protein n=1 Tax=Peribacillus loiseleuriae TaxID=1679170 RepID=UPI000A9B3018|nr:hypothetical protein [Peribacillus loiseleuriae]